MLTKHCSALCRARARRCLRAAGKVETCSSNDFSLFCFSFLAAHENLLQKIKNRNSCKIYCSTLLANEMGKFPSCSLLRCAVSYYLIKRRDIKQMSQITDSRKLIIYCLSLFGVERICFNCSPEGGWDANNNSVNKLIFLIKEEFNV